MALTDAYMFKSFYPSILTDPNGKITFHTNGQVSVKCKWDNFSERIDITDENSPANIYQYRYITVDRQTIFEIEKIIKNGKLYTLFLTYVGMIDLGAPSPTEWDGSNDGIYLSGITPRTLTDLHFSEQQYREILGDKLGIDRTPRYFDGNNFIMAVKIDVSELPQNLDVYFNETNNSWSSGEQIGVLVNNRIHVPLFPPFTDMYQLTPEDFTTPQNFTSLIIPVPMGNKDQTNLLRVNNGQPQSIYFKDFITTVIKLLSDLTLSVSVVLLNNNSLFMTNIAYNSATPVTFTCSNGTFIINVNNYGTGHPIRAVQGVEKQYPVFVATPALRFGNGAGYSANFIPINLTVENATKQITTTLNIFGQNIDVSARVNDIIYAQNTPNGLRIYIDYNRNIYKDVGASLEFTKNAYSNYDAYQKANIDLVNSQKLSQLTLQQQQRRDQIELSLKFSGYQTLGTIAGSAATGNYAGIGTALGGYIGQATTAYQQDALTRQSEYAAHKLTYSQELNRARATITPPDTIAGSIGFFDFIKAYGENSPILLYELFVVDLSDTDYKKLYSYCLDSGVLIDFNDTIDIVPPDWITPESPFLMRFDFDATVNKPSVIIRVL